MSYRTIQAYRQHRAETRPVTYSVMVVINDKGDAKPVTGYENIETKEEARDLAREFGEAGMGFYYWSENK